MESLRSYFDENKANAINKWLHYFEVYEQYFKKYRNTPVVILEIGVYQGGTLNMWRDYFGAEAQIFAIDINPLCKQFETENTHIFIGSQEDRAFLRMIKTQIPKIDILIDDGGHTMNQQIVSFEELYSHIKSDGIYLGEDLHSSYWKDFGGGYKNKRSFIEYSKNFIDYINAWHSRDKRLVINNISRSMYAIHYYDSMLVIEKREITAPQAKMVGEVIIPISNFSPPKLSLFKRILLKLKF